MEALRGLLGHGRADGGMVRVAVEEGMAVRVHLRMGMRRPTAACSMCEMGEGSAERITRAARRALICGDGRGGSGANCRVMEDSRETTLA